MADLYYIDSDYFTPDAGYYVYIANAEATINSTATVTCVAGKIVDITATLSSEFTQTTLASKVNGVDLYAFGEASLTATVDRTRETTVSLNGVFDQSVMANRTRETNYSINSVVTQTTDGDRIRYADSNISSAFTLSGDGDIIGSAIEFAATLSSAFTITAQGSRIRDTAITLSAQFTQTTLGSKTNGIELFAFSEAAIAVQVDRIRGNNISQSTQFNIAVDYTRIIQGDSDADGIFSTNVVYTRSRDFLAEFQTAFSLTCVISHIEGADLVSLSFASLSITASRTRNVSSSISSTATVSASVGFLKEVSSSILGQFSVTAASRIYIRSVSYSQNSETQNGVNYSAVKIVNTNSKFGIGNLYVEDTFPTYYPRDTLPQYQVSNGSTTKLFSTSITAASPRTFSTTNGINYTSSTSNIPSNHGNIIWDGSKYVTAVQPGSAGNLKIYTSTDGITWTLITTTLYVIPITYQPQIQYLSPYYYIGCSTDTGNTTVVRNTTLSGGTWVNRGTINAGTNAPRGWIGSYNTGSEIGFFGRYDNAAYGTYGIRPVLLGNNNANLTYDLSLYSQADGYVSSGGYANGQFGIVTKFNDGTRNIYVNTGGTWSLVSSGGHDTTISAVNNRWFVESEGTLSTGTSLSSLTAYGTYNFALGLSSDRGPENISPVGYVGGVYTYSRDGSVYRSNNATSWNSTSYLTGAYAPGSLVYFDPDYDIGNFATIDFWAKGSFSLGFYDTGYKTKEIFVLDRLYAHIQTSYTNDLYINESTAAWDGSIWNHVRLSINGTTASLYKNGVRVATTNSWYTDSFNAPLTIKGLAGFSGGYIDELLITDQLLTNPSVTSFSVPTNEYLNDTNTDLLLHFNTDLLDDSRFNVVEQATLTSTSTLTATSTVSYASNLGTLSTSASMVVYASKNAEIVLAAFTNASLGVVYNRIRYQSSTITSEFSQSTTVSKTLDTPANLSCSATQLIVYDRIRDNQITTDSIFSELTVGEVSRDVAINMSVSAGLTASIPDRTRDTVLNLSSSFALSTTPVATLDAIALVMSAGSITANAVKTTDITDTLSSAFTFTADNAGSIIRVNALVMSAGTMTTVAKKNTDITEILPVAFNVVAETADSLNIRGSADLSSEFTSTVDNDRIRYADITADAIATELTVITKTVGNTVSMTSTVTLSLSADRTRGFDSAPSSTSSLTADNTRVKLSAGNFTSATSLTAIGFSNSDVPVVMTLTTSMTTIGQLTKETLLLAFSNASLSVSARRTRSTSVSMSNSVQVTITASRIRYVQITTNSIASSMIVIGAIKGIIQTLPIVSTMTTVFDVLHTTDNVYIIPFENRAYIINQETRTKKITSETREYKIRR